MAQFANVMEILKLLDKSNCRKCGEKTCMAFAAAVLNGKRLLHECPTAPAEAVKKYGKQNHRKNFLEEENEKVIGTLKQKLQTIDLQERAEKLGAVYNDGKFTVPIMGKNLSIDQHGNVYTDLHVNPWILVSVLNYIIYSEARPLTKNWVPLRELPSGQEWYRLFEQQSDRLLRKTADAYADLFTDLVRMFGGAHLEDQFKSDVAVALSPLPLVPMLICYWKAEEGMESALGLFFDDTAEANLGINGVYYLGVGFSVMIDKLVKQHGFSG